MTASRSAGIRRSNLASTSSAAFMRSTIASPLRALRVALGGVGRVPSRQGSAENSARGARRVGATPRAWVAM